MTCSDIQDVSKLCYINDKGTAGHELDSKSSRRNRFGNASDINYRGLNFKNTLCCKGGSVSMLLYRVFLSFVP